MNGDPRINGAPAPRPPEAFALTTSRGFESWLAQAGVGLAFTTYQAGKLFALGVGPNGRLSVFERTFRRAMGLAASADGRRLVLATQNQIVRFDNALPPGERTGEGHDALYVPRLSWTTGDLDIHDIGFGEGGRPVFVATRFSCLATVSDGFSFRPLWKPPFVSRLAPEDRCHLNGLALAAGRPLYATAVAPSDVADGWRDRRVDGGVAIDVESGEIVAEGLAMPHSPRLAGGRLWLLNSGTGDFGFVDRASGRFEPVAFCPGYARGLAFVGRHAVIGLSLPRENRTFQGLPLEAALAARGAVPRCGLIVVDTATGDIVAWARIEGIVRELYDVAVLADIRRPALLGFMTDEIDRVIAIDDGGA